MERTVILLKPDAVQRRLVGKIVGRFEDKGLKIVAMKMMRLSESLVRSHYAQHEGKDFYEPLLRFVTAGPTVFMVLEGVDAVALHPRTARQQYRGSADWSLIRRLGEELTIPVMGNGDVRRPEDVLRMLEETRCHMVMIGRAVLTNPWIFRQSADLLATGCYREPTLAERADFVRTHFRILARELEGKALLHKLKVFTGKYTHGLPGGRELRRRLDTIREPAELLDEVERFFAAMLAA